MPIRYSTFCINFRLVALSCAIGAGGGPGNLVLLAGANPVSTIGLANPCGTAADGVLTFNTPLGCRMKNGADTVFGFSPALEAGGPANEPVLSIHNSMEYSAKSSGGGSMKVKKPLRRSIKGRVPGICKEMDRYWPVNNASRSAKSCRTPRRQGRGTRPTLE